MDAFVRPRPTQRLRVCRLRQYALDVHNGPADTTTGQRPRDIVQASSILMVAKTLGSAEMIPVRRVGLSRG